MFSRPVEVNTNWNPAITPLSSTDQKFTFPQPEGVYDYTHDPMLGEYDIPRADPYSYDLYDTASLYDEVMPEGLAITSATERSPDKLELPPGIPI